MAEGAGMMANGYTLVIGDKNLSSWSLPPWLALKHCHIPFEEAGIRLRQPDSKAEILRHTPSGKVPAQDEARGGVGHPRHPGISRRAPSRASPVAARRGAAGGGAQHLGGNAFWVRHVAQRPAHGPALPRLPSPPIGEPLASDIRRIVAIWKDTRARFSKGGPFLFGGFTCADAMYAPVATRFRTYGG